MNTSASSSPFYSAEHAAFRDAMRRFVAREITPNVEAWEAQASFPVELYRKAGTNPFSSCLPLLIQMPIFLK